MRGVEVRLKQSWSKGALMEQDSSDLAKMYLSSKYVNLFFEIISDTEIKFNSSSTHKADVAYVCS